MRETRLYGSEGGEAKAFPTPILVIGENEETSGLFKVPTPFSI